MKEHVQPKRTKKPPLLEKTGPNEKDRAIARLLAEGHSVGRIAFVFGDEPQSVSGRIAWMKAKRWMTYDGKLLTAWQRERLIQRETAFIEVEGVGMEVATC